MSYLDETRTIRFEGPTAASPRFVAPPVLRWAPVTLSRRFTVTVADRDRVVWSAATTDREIDLAPAWPRLAHGPVDVLVQGFDEAGEEVSVRAHRRFWRVPGFDGVRPEPGDWEGCVRRAVGYLLAPARDEVAEYERDDPRCAWRSFEDSVTGVRGQLGFPALHHPSFVLALLGFAERHPRDPLAPEAERQALGYGQWLLDHQLPGDWRCGGLAPSTIERGEVGGWVEGGNITLFRAARVGEAFIRLTRYTGEDRYLERTRRIAAVLLDLQRDDGSWPYRVDPRTGETSESYTSAVVTPIRLLAMLEELGAGTTSEIATWRQGRDRAEAWLLAGPVADGRWEGMYEDIPGTPAWSNLENWDTNETIRYLLSGACAAPGKVAHAKRLNDYIEDQFVVWRAEESPVTVRCTTPSVLEQYRCYHPMEVHTGNWLVSLLALHQATGEEHYLAKGIAAANSIAAGQHESGALSTWGFDTRFGKVLQAMNWPGCNAVAVTALLHWQAYHDGLSPTGGNRDFHLGLWGV